MARVKMNAKHEYEFIANFKILQNVFRQHKVEKVCNPHRECFHDWEVRMADERTQPSDRGGCPCASFMSARNYPPPARLSGEYETLESASRGGDMGLLT